MYTMNKFNIDTLWIPVEINPKKYNIDFFQFIKYIHYVKEISTQLERGKNSVNSGENHAFNLILTRDVKPWNR